MPSASPVYPTRRHGTMPTIRPIRPSRLGPSANPGFDLARGGIDEIFVTVAPSGRLRSPKGAWARRHRSGPGVPPSRPGAGDRDDALRPRNEAVAWAMEGPG